MPDDGGVSAVSPTGKAIVPPAAVPWLMVGVLCINGALTALASSAPSPVVKMAATVAIATIAPLVAMASPGLRSKP